LKKKWAKLRAEIKETTTKQGSVTAVAGHSSCPLCCENGETPNANIYVAGTGGNVDVTFYSCDWSTPLGVVSVNNYALVSVCLPSNHQFAYSVSADTTPQFANIVVTTTLNSGEHYVLDQLIAPYSAVSRECLKCPYGGHKTAGLFEIAFHGGAPLNGFNVTNCEGDVYQHLNWVIGVYSAEAYGLSCYRFPFRIISDNGVDFSFYQHDWFHQTEYSGPDNNGAGGYSTNGVLNRGCPE